MATTRIIPCPLRPNGKHEFVWAFNGPIVHRSPLETCVKVTGVYTCECGRQKLGKVDPKMPGADVRDYVSDSK